MKVICLDMEGVITPEVWIELADRTGIDALRRTTRDEPDYDALMKYRLGILDEHGLKLPDILSIIETLDPLPGALEFLSELRRRYPVIILSDTFAEFAGPLLVKLNHPTLFCHRLDVDTGGRIKRHVLRMRDHKREAVKALRSLNFTVCAAGDSYNDTGMLGAADAGFLFRPPPNVMIEFPQYPVFSAYDGLLEALHSVKIVDRISVGDGCSGTETFSRSCDERA